MMAHALRGLAAVAMAVLTGLVPAQAQTVKCPDGRVADGVERAGTARHCLVMRKFDPPGANPRVLVVFLHGDNGGKIELPAEQGTAFSLADKLKTTTVALQRPGYRSALGISDGQTSALDDDYSATNLEIIASALGQLRQLNPGKKILLVGHSGGAAMTALMAARFPAAADAWLPVACPCDVPAWRQWRSASSGKTAAWTNSLSPMDEVGRMPPGTRIALVAGSKDDNTLPKFSEAYVARLQARAIPGRLTYAPSSTHVSIQRAPEFFMVAQSLVDGLSR